MDVLVGLIEKIVKELEAGKTVVVHCNGGKGRSGMVAVGVLITFGVPPSEAVQKVRTARPGTIRNPAQIFYINMFSRYWDAKEEESSGKKSRRRSESWRQSANQYLGALGWGLEAHKDQAAGDETDAVEMQNLDKDAHQNETEAVEKEEKEEEVMLKRYSKKILRFWK
eukprot:TRINITY_DN16544_c0_g1_i1.p1 TRINITY_DN16544_c0_g1~~TRINITY_DN16544_c0_g1_i1.p1  ORF type:complete len:168 (+),score=40.96 TRINITY_DN16544_c0_g1_i1:83-586(+)